MQKEGSKQGLLIFVLLFLGVVNLKGQDPAFPGAEGWAASTHGGRGGQIIRVTNLNASGSGSFAAGVNTTGPRIVVFEVGGVIDLSGERITIQQPYLTVAGQTAPSPGITFIDGSIIIVETHDIIIQHIRVRPGASRHSLGWEPDGISLSSAHDVILDHCSVSWAVDENMSASGPRFDGNSPDEWRANTSHSVTISNNIIAEGLSHATHSKGEHSKGSLIHDNTTEIAVIKNLYISNVNRNPHFKAGARGVVVNNYIYNPELYAIRYHVVASEWTGHTLEKGQMSVVGNVLKYGPSTESPALMDADTGPVEIYMEDNIALNQSNGNIDLYKGLDSRLVTVKPIWNNNVQVMNAEDVREYIVENVGARPWDRDEIDKRLINEMLNGSGQIIDLETEVGGFPDHQPTYQPFNEDEWDLKYMISLLPTVKIVSPSEGEQFLLDSTVTVNVNASDYDGQVTRVELFVNGESEGVDTSAPYEYQFSRDSIGCYSLVAIAEDDSGFQSISDTVYINIIDIIMYNFDLNIIGSGTVVQNPEGTIFPKGTEVTLTAIPAEGYEFAEWSGDLHGGFNPATLYLHNHHTISASFLESVEPNLNLHLAFDGTSRTTVEDMSGNLHLAYIANMDPITLVSGKFGDGLQFDGADDYIRVFRKDDLDFTAHGFSLCFWIKQTDTDITMPWLSFMEGNIGYAVYHDASGCVTFEINDGYIPSFVEGSNTVFVNGSWVFVTAIVDRNPDELRLYANGELIASAEDSTGNISNTALTIYLATDGSLNNFFKGAMDEVRIYNYALSETDIQKLAASNVTSLNDNENPVQYRHAIRNYPNPFNPMTTIEYTISKINRVELSVYNIHGQRVSILVDELKAAGKYKVPFNGGDLSNGLYVYRLSLGEETISQKMLLVK